MSVKLQLLLIFSVLPGLFIMVNLIRKNTLELKYALLWLLMAITVLGIMVFPQSIIDLTQVLGFQVPFNGLLFVGFYFLVAILFSVTIIVSKQSQRIKTLNQELAILKYEIKALKD
jgi:hypothetical protein